jgi:glycerate-2-kinase
MIHIKNRDKLIGNGETPLIREFRAVALECIEQVIEGAQPKQLIKRKLKVENGFLCVEDFSFDLNRFKHVYVVGGGKAGAKMALAVEEILGDYITAGTVNIPCGTAEETRIIE